MNPTVYGEAPATWKKVASAAPGTEAGPAPPAVADQFAVSLNVPEPLVIQYRSACVVLAAAISAARAAKVCVRDMLHLQKTNGSCDATCALIETLPQMAGACSRLETTLAKPVPTPPCRALR